MPPKTQTPRYEYLEVRLASFTHSHVSNNGPLAASQAHRGAKSKAWPHPLSEPFNPTSLSKAGFFFNASEEQPDNCTCFVCGKSLGSWEPGDDPSLEHVAHDEDNCGWARAVCEVESKERVNNHTYIFASADRLPTSTAMESRRHDTFSNWWPYDDVPKHSATSEKMARAGWHCTPSVGDTDNASCVYCGTSLSGWEPTDDPLEEHRRKRPNCVFFTAGDRVGVEVTMLSEPVHASPKRKANGTAKKLAKSSSSQAAQQTSTSTSESGPTPAEPVKKKRGRPPKKKEVIVDDEPEPEREPRIVEEAAPEPEPLPPVEPKKRGRAKKVKSEVEEAIIIVSDDDIVTAKPPARTGKGKGKGKGKQAAIASQPSASDSHAEPEPTRLTRFASQQTLASESEDVTDAEPHPVRRTRAASAQPEPTPFLRKSTRTRTKPDIISESEADVVPAPPLTRSTRARPAQSQVQPDDLALSDLNLSEQAPQAKISAKAKPKKKTKTPVAPPSVEEPATEASDVEMQDAASVQATNDIEAEPLTSETGDDESSDVEEVERTILGPSQSIPEQISPVTPPPRTRAVPPTLPGPSLPIPAMHPVLPLPPISSFTEAELSMTLEEWVRHETRRQYEVLRAEGERRIAEFTEKARVIRAKIEAL